MQKPRRIIVNNVPMHIVWSKRMTKSLSKIIIKNERIIIQLSEPLISSKEDITNVIKSLFYDKLILTDDGKIHAKGKKIGSGGFSDVYCCLDNPALAIKTKVREHTLKNEIMAYNIFEKARTDKIYVPKYHGCSGTDCIIIDRYPTDLRQVYKVINITKLNTIIIDVISSLDFIHSSGLLHCDIKQGNVLLDSDNRAVLVDFGLSRPYPTELSCTPHKKYSRYGTITYMSRDIHDQVKPTRRSDIETLGWVIIELLGGKLPWKECVNVEIVGSQKHKAFDDINQFLSRCFLDNIIPSSIVSYMNYLNQLKYIDPPNYEILKQMFEYNKA